MLKMNDLINKVSIITGIKDRDYIDYTINDYLFNLQRYKGVEYERWYRKRLTVKIILKDIFMQCRHCGSYDTHEVYESFPYQPSPPLTIIMCNKCNKEIKAF